ncbi:hypothetical protein C8Q79DRAFT_249822 [Trametes meyenii]|nr:hypothetical protein C8Q79DRAFT_249822 [Trametes meyenii]
MEWVTIVSIAMSSVLAPVYGLFCFTNIFLASSIIMDSRVLNTTITPHPSLLSFSGFVTRPRRPPLFSLVLRPTHCVRLEYWKAIQVYPSARAAFLELLDRLFGPAPVMTHQGRVRDPFCAVCLGFICPS